VNKLQFAHQLGELRNDLAANAHGGNDPYDWPDRAAAAAFLRLLDRLAGIGGRGSSAVVAAVTEALDVYAAVSAEVGQEQQAARQREEASRQRAEAEYAEAVRRHQVAIGAECPYCGAAPGTVCRTAGPSGTGNPKGVHDHASRYRAALAMGGQNGQAP
jgi:hypothetical protein